jgi:predicted DNA binding CopG/RHH family protein
MKAGKDMTTKDEHFTKNRESHIPEFANREEEAAFWDNHDMSDYWDELKPVKLKVAKNLSKGITIRFDPETLRALRQQAHEKGIGPTTLARMWILERLRDASSPH